MESVGLQKHAKLRACFWVRRKVVELCLENVVKDRVHSDKAWL
jgi:hypothetical protein